MFRFEAHVGHVPRFNVAHVNAEASALADRAAATLTNYSKLSLVAFGKVASGATLKGTRWTAIGGRNSAVFGVAGMGVQRRQVLSGRGWFFITSGRRAGAKMPIRQVGTGPRGGKLFEPLPLVLRWFNALNIPREAWFPILRAIKRRGIKPIPLAKRAIQAARPALQSDARLTAMRIREGLIKKI